MPQLSDYDFELPPERIALRPAEPRESARLLLVPPSGPFEHLRVGELPHLLGSGDVLVVNDSWVIPAALQAQRKRGDSVVAITLNLLERLGPSRWTALARPGKRLRPGDVLEFGESLSATILHKDQAQLELEFCLVGSALHEAITRLGSAPLPPYILSKRAADRQDLTDYQTTYADNASTLQSVAAPTAGLHFSTALLEKLRDQGVKVVPITLGVGAGTFLPVKSDDLDQHAMHAEAYAVSPRAADCINEARARGGRIIAVGTTSLRALESCAWSNGLLEPTAGSTRLFIRPGHRFRAVDALVTNFHLPRSTLFMLVCAFAGLERMRDAYAHAIRHAYRFYSYGDASLLWRERRDA